MSEQGYEQLTLFQAGFLASPSLSPGSTEAKKMTVTSGLKCLESYRNYSPLGLLVRTCLGSSIWHSTRSYLTWKVSGTKCRHSLFRLAASTHGIEERGSALWPTILANGMGSTGHQMMLQKLVDKGMITQEERRQMIMGNGGKINPEWAEWFQGYRKAWTGLIPTVTNGQLGGAPNKRLVGGGVLQTPTERTRRDFPGRDYWETEPELDRVADGIPNRVDRIRCLGNAVVPQQFYPFFKAIAEVEDVIGVSNG